MAAASLRLDPRFAKRTVVDNGVGQHDAAIVSICNRFPNVFYQHCRESSGRLNVSIGKLGSYRKTVRNAQCLSLNSLFFRRFTLSIKIH
jgi:hypothetical protein